MKPIEGMEHLTAATLIDRAVGLDWIGKLKSITIVALIALAVLQFSYNRYVIVESQAFVSEKMDSAVTIVSYAEDRHRADEILIQALKLKVETCHER